MNSQYRIYWKEKDGGRYATAEELAAIYLQSDGCVSCFAVPRFSDDDDHPQHNDITAEVVVEFWTGKVDSGGVKVFGGDQIADNEDNIFTVEWDDFVHAWVAPLVQGQIYTLAQHSSRGVKVVGTIHNPKRQPRTLS